MRWAWDKNSGFFKPDSVEQGTRICWFGEFEPAAGMINSSTGAIRYDMICTPELSSKGTGTRRHDRENNMLFIDSHVEGVPVSYLNSRGVYTYPFLYNAN